ncbi:hypothetical protein L1987_03455 [Smallanthus sonchifolius]|uniref:Uncharacterized protein n=1 Tax=Smallanthus sonchifolius TaxID=185202 RepID=A0ACB9KAM0_9ASTR|nr:hypothetical protein L1987_03455 [Smallanthus sonchifolius]
MLSKCSKAHQKPVQARQQRIPTRMRNAFHAVANTKFMDKKDGIRPTASMNLGPIIESFDTTRLTVRVFAHRADGVATNDRSRNRTRDTTISHYSMATSINLSFGGGQLEGKYMLEEDSAISLARDTSGNTPMHLGRKVKKQEAQTNRLEVKRPE